MPADEEPEGSAEEAGDEHLDDLCFSGDGPGGSYRPQGFELRLSGAESVADRVTYVHETHHASLNDSTAWGALLHVIARLPQDANSPAYAPLVDACRLLHESYATYASVSTVEASDGPQPDALAAYPRYAPLYRRMAALVSAAAGPHRRYLLSTAVARCCMQSPVLELASERGLVGLTVSAVRSIDTPDGRYRALLRLGDDLMAGAAAAGDSAAGLDLGALSRIDGADPEVASHDDYDEMWGRWEEAAYGEIAGALALRGAHPLAYNGHQEWTGVVLTVAERTWGRLGLAAASRMAPAADDRSIAEGVLAQVRHQVAAEPYSARLLRGDAGDVATLVAEHARIGGTPVLIADARLPERLLAAYRWEAEDADALSTQAEPVVGVRLLEDDGYGGTQIVMVPLEDPAALERVAADWAGRGPAIAVIAASCLIDMAWQQAWWGPMSRTLRTIGLIDIEPARLTRSWSATGSVKIGMVTIEDTAGRWQGLALEAGGGVLWLGLGDSITAKFLRHAIAPVVGAVEGAEFLGAWTETLRIAATHLLATETILDFAGLEARL